MRYYRITTHPPQESYFHGSSEVQLLKQKYRSENVTDNLLTPLPLFFVHK